MLLRIDRSMLPAINRRASEILRGEDRHTSAADPGDWPPLRLELSREEIHAAVLIAQQRTGWPEGAATPDRNAASSHKVES